MLRLLLALSLVIPSLGSAAFADTLQRIRDSGALTIGYRDDAPPISYKTELGEAAGYSVELCRAVAVRLKRDLNLPQMAVRYVLVTAENRFQAVIDGKVDLLCEPTTVTLSRRERVDSSVPTFLDGASVLGRADRPLQFQELGGKRVGVRAGTTTEETLRNSLGEMGVKAEVVSVSDHKDGVARLLSGDITAYFGDRAILHYIAAGSGNPDLLVLSDQYLTYEPYALALQRGDGQFRLAVDRALSYIFRSGEIANVFTAAFGPNAEPTPELQALYRISALPQ